MNFDDILNKYREAAYSKSDLGTRFEELIARYLKTYPLYSSQLEDVWLWNEFPYRSSISGQDTGIDIVAKTKSDEYWAVQCKFYSEDHRVSKGDVDSFLAASGRTFKDEHGKDIRFSRRMVVSTTDNWSTNAIESLENQDIPVMRVGLNMLREAEVDWKLIYEGLHGKEARTKRYELRNHQQEAFDKAIEHYKTNDRGQMIMACGTGKTFTSLKIAEALSGDKGCILFLAPSIALVGQTLREWSSQAKDDLNVIAVCSDPKVTRRRDNDDLEERVEDLGAPATTDPSKIVKRYEDGEGLTVIFSTYHSIDVVIEAQRAGIPEFDMIVCDEAHRTTGVIVNKSEEKYFTKVHDNNIIAGKKRLYMTATPRIYGVAGKETAKEESVTLCSMDDSETYGTEFYKISFGEAVERDLLTDYRVLILTITEEDIPDFLKNEWKRKITHGNEVDTETESKIWGCMNALAKNLAYDETIARMDPGHMESAVAFARTIRSSKDMMDIFNNLAKLPTAPVNLKVNHVDGTMNAFEREGLLNWLKQGTPDTRVLSNVRCLSEGVDVPALDSIMFLSNKNSLIDIVQSVGRVMRRAPGKKYGYIIIPVIAPEGVSAEEALDDDEQYNIVWQVLRALRSHDERLEAEINTLNYSKTPGKILNARLMTAREAPSGEDFEEWKESRQYLLDEFETALMARLVLKVGNRGYIENWAKDVAEIMPDLIDRLNKICKHEEHGYKQFKPAFTRYLKGLRANINGGVSEDDAIDMLAQQIITKPIFTELFGDDTFVHKNPVSLAINGMLDEIGEKNALEGIDMEKFYTNVKTTLSRVDTEEGKQKTITALYEKFFKNAFPRDQAINGVVYTPIEIVDFILRSASDILKEEFGMDINDEGVNILDPFTGTGTFIARLMELGLITKENLERKYREELFANEITLLAYYIAAVNIENTYSRLMQPESYTPFENIVLTDTFNIEEICRPGGAYSQTTITGEEFFTGNRERICKEHKTPITMIIGNPPYGAVQRSANDDAKKRRYDKGIDARIVNTYLRDELFHDRKGNVNSVYDNYIRAFRWATDRIGNNDGIISFVTPSGWMTGSAFEGFRKTVEKEFSKIYVFDLRGDATTQGERRRKEGGGIFADGSRTPIVVVLLIKRKDHKGKAKIQYFKTPDYAKRNDKINLLTDSKSFIEMANKKKLERIEPKPNGDWIIERNELFQELIPLAGDTYKKFEKHEGDSIFVGFSRGYGTSRDVWSYNSSKEKVSDNIENMIIEYNNLIENGGDPYKAKVKWSQDLLRDLENGIRIQFDSEHITTAAYRPFYKNWLYSDKRLIHETASVPKLFPTPDTDNLLICIPGVGVKKDFSCLITNCMTDVQLMANGQCFPLYWYEDSSDIRAKNKQRSLLEDAPSMVRHDGVSDYALKNVRSKYGPDVTKEDIFYYVYGYLHSPEYGKTFSDDLKYALPRIELVKDYETFKKFSTAGRELAELHLNYEDIEAPESVSLSGTVIVEDIRNDDDFCRVTKMRVYPDKGKVVYNKNITVENIPSEAFEYIVNGRSAIGWIVDQYQYRKDRASGIVNDPNEYAGGSYVFRLLMSVIGVSVETMKIVKELPKLRFDEDENQE